MLSSPTPLEGLHYRRLNKPAKGVVRRFLAKVSGFSRQQLTRLIAQHGALGRIEDRRRKPPTRPFARRYTPADILALAELDALHGTLSGPATKKLCERAFRVFGDARYERLATLSNGHLYNLRQSKPYRRQRVAVGKTRPTTVNIGERRQPKPHGQPGYLRVDSVHQGDLDGLKGLYLINAIDEVTQFQYIAAVERISERFLLPILEQLLLAFPFAIRGFHADNGCPFKSESHGRDEQYINHRVAALLKSGATFQALDAIALKQSDNEAARQLNQARQSLFQSINAA